MFETSRSGIPELSVIGGLVFGGWDVFQDAVQAAVVVPVDPFDRWVIDFVEGSQRPGPKRAILTDCLGLEPPDRGLGQCVVVGVADATDRRGNVLQDKGSAKAIEVYWLPPSERTIARPVSAAPQRGPASLRPTKTSSGSERVAHNPVGVRVFDGAVEELAFIGAVLGDVSQPDLIGSLGAELGLHEVFTQRRFGSAAQSALLGEDRPDLFLGTQPCNPVLAGDDSAPRQLIRDEPVPECEVIGVDVVGCVDQVWVVQSRCDRGALRHL